MCLETEVNMLTQVLCKARKQSLKATFNKTIERLELFLINYTHPAKLFIKLTDFPLKDKLTFSFKICTSIPIDHPNTCEVTVSWWSWDPPAPIDD